MASTQLQPIVSGAPFAPHGHCYLWNTDLVWLHAGSDALIALAYFSIPIALLYVKRRRPDIDLRLIFSLFATFILACGVTHAFDVWNIWRADYWPAGIAKAFTAVVSITAAVVLWWKMPLVLAWPSHNQLRTSNEELRREVSRRREMYNSMQESEAQLREAFDNAPIGKALVDVDGNWIKVNPALCAILGYSEQELTSRDFQSITWHEDLDRDLEQAARMLVGEIDTYQMEKRYLHKQGHLVWALLSVTLVRSTGGAPQYFIAQILDISERKRMENELREIQAELEARVEARTRELAAVNSQLQESNRRLQVMAGTDSLTGLPNRWELMETLEKQLSESLRYDTEWCLMLIDVDHFKQINDRHGHTIGDRALEAFGKAIRTHTRDSDFAARYGGDEFCCMVPHADLAHTRQLAEKLRETLAAVELTDPEGNRIRLTCSIGIAQWEPSLDTVAKIIDAADAWLYRAKQAGRDRVAGGFAQE